MGPIPRNILANIVGQGWMAAMSVLLVPLYVRILGVAAFGLIGVYATLQASLQILDLGLSQTMNRQMARYLALPDKSGEARDFVRTVEVGYWAIGLCIGAIVAAAAPVIARNWLTAGALPVATVERAVRIMGVLVALQWPLSLYDGGLTGLQRQVLLNALRVGLASVTAIGSAIVLLFWSPTVTAYFGWQVAASSLGLGALAASLWRCLPRAPRRPTFDYRILKTHGRLAAGMGGIAISGVLLTQLDKLVLSRLLDLGAFGYYTIAAMASSVLPVLISGPIFNGVFPQLTSFVAAGSESEVAQLYHRSSQLMAVLVATVGGVIAAFSFEILLVWTRSASTATAAAPVVSVLIVGMALNALMTLPYALQLAHGWTTLGLRLNVALLVLLVPTILALTARYGTVGAAGAWVVLNGMYMLVGVPLTHRKLLRGHMGAWFTADVLPPVAAAFIAIGAGRMLVRPDAGTVVIVTSVALVLGAALSLAVLSAPLVRRGVIELVTRR